MASEMECWLRPNRRALAMAMIAPGLLLAVAIAMALGWPIDHMAGRVAGIVLAVIAVLALAGLINLTRLPRIGFRDDHLLVYLRKLHPIRVPIELVEVFFLGEGPSSMPGADETKVVSATIVVRLAEAATEWRHRPVTPALGHWCDGYIIIRGTWCEPITRDLMMQLNRRLVQAHRRQKNRKAVEAS